MKRFLYIIVYLLCLSGIANGTTYYVNVNKPPGGNGTSWATAFKNLQDALDAAQPEDEIWVAAGVYTPTKYVSDEYQSSSFSMAFVLETNNVKIYGGYPATGNPTKDERNRAVHKTILSGDIDNNDKSDGDIVGLNVAHVVINLAADVLLDGFTISGGDAMSTHEFIYQGHQIKGAYGGGVLNAAFSKLVLKNSIIKANRAAYGGGGIANETGSSSEFVNVLICGNISSQGGGMYNLGADNVELTNVTISGNTNDGIAGQQTFLQLINTIVFGNTGNDLVSTVQFDFIYSLIYQSFYFDTHHFDIFSEEPKDIFMYWVAASNTPSNWDNYRLKPGCPVIDAGNNAYVNENNITDLNGNSRIMNGIVDLGASEFHFMTMVDVTVHGLPPVYVADDLKIRFYNTDGALVEDLHPGEYRMIVSYPGYFMTYYNEDGTQASTWKDATPIIVEPANNADQHIPIVVTLTQEPGMEHGTITISGTLGFADDDIHGLSKIRPVSNLNGNVSLSSASAVKSDEYELVKTIQTTDGHYSFTDLPEGNYRITADIAGFDPGTFDIHVVEGTETVNFIVNTGTKNITAESKTVTETPSWQARNIKVYPNPAVDVVHVSGLEGVYIVKMVNILGQLLYSATGTSPELSLNIGHLPSGMYFLRIESNQATTTYKIIKQ